MFRKIKDRLLVMFLTQKKKLALLTCFVFFGLFAVSQITHAFVLDVANVQLDALDFIDNTILKWLVFLAITAVESITLLIISAHLLDWSASLPVGLDNDIVNAGWQFTSGLANISFILIFIIIALSYVLKLETFGMKKALPRLIIIALLVNFSLLFVKMFADFGWIFQGSLRSVFFDGGGFATAAAESLKTSGENLIGLIIGIPTAYLITALIPYANVAALVTIGGLVLASGGGALIGAISQTIMVIVFNFTVGLIFLVFAVLFLIRIAVLWLLAIIAPLALMAYILPSTQKFFSQWLKTLVQWSLLGVIALFLAGLGIKLFGLTTLDAGQKIAFQGQLGKWEFFSTFYKYIFLIIYLVVILGACKKLVPAGAQAVWGLGEMVVSRGQKWAGGAAKKLAAGAPELSYVNRAEMATRRWAERIPMIGRALGGPGATGARLSKDRAKIAEEFKGRSPADIRAAISLPPLNPQDRLRQAAGLQMLAEMDVLEERDRAFLGDAQRYGANIGAITGKMPTWTELTPEDIAAGTTLPQAIINRVRRIANDKAKDIRPEALNSHDVVRALNPSQLLNITRSGNNQQRQNIVNAIRAIDPAIVNTSGRLRHLLGSGARPSGLDRGAIRYISEQQVAGTWPNAI